MLVALESGKTVQVVGGLELEIKAQLEYILGAGANLSGL